MSKTITISESAYETIKKYATRHKRSLISEMDILLNRIQDGVGVDDDEEDEDEDEDEEEYTGVWGHTTEEKRAYYERINRQEQERKEREAREKAFNLDKELEWWREGRESGELYDITNLDRLSFLIERVTEDGDDYTAILEDMNKILKRH